MDTVGQNAPRRASVLSESLALIRTNKRAFLVSNLVYYAVLIAGLVIVTFNRELQQTMYGAVGQTFGEGGPLAAIGEAYGTGQTFRAVALIFVVNLVIGTFLSITLPSLIVPFSSAAGLLHYTGRSSGASSSPQCPVPSLPGGTFWRGCS